MVPVPEHGASTKTVSKSSREAASPKTASRSRASPDANETPPASPERSRRSALRAHLRAERSTATCLRLKPSRSERLALTEVVVPLPAPISRHDPSPTALAATSWAFRSDATASAEASASRQAAEPISTCENVPGSTSNAEGDAARTPDASNPGRAWIAAGGGSRALESMAPALPAPIDSVIAEASHAGSPARRAAEASASPPER